MKGRALLVWWSFEEPDAQEPYPSLGARLRSWVYKTVHFVSGTRWDRCFRLIR